VALCREGAEAHSAKIVVDCDPGLTARTNPRLVVHTLVNILDNAVKYGLDGGRVDVVAKPDGDAMRITVADQGPGVPSRLHSRVLERFCRVDGVGRVKKGSGLGLAIVKHIAMAQYADIRMESDIGIGSKSILSPPRT
jgi:two-component system sensor histidine kinase SenX3